MILLQIDNLIQEVIIKDLAKGFGHGLASGFKPSYWKGEWNIVKNMYHNLKDTRNPLTTLKRAWDDKKILAIPITGTATPTKSRLVGAGIGNIISTDVLQGYALKKAYDKTKQVYNDNIKSN